MARSQVLPFKAVHAKYQMSDRDTVGATRVERIQSFPGLDGFWVTVT